MIATSHDLFPQLPSTLLLRSRSRAESGRIWQGNGPLLQKVAQGERMLEVQLASGQVTGYAGYSCSAGQQVQFIQAAGQGGINWREGLACPVSDMNNRCRAAIDLLQWCCGLSSTSRVYMTEQTTSTYRWLSERYPAVVGSEYLGPDVQRGAVVGSLRHEDLTALSFADHSFDIVTSFDCLEHIPDYRQALREMVRVLSPGGCALLTFPFNGQERTLVRASHDFAGWLVHHETPEYHGDPIGNGDGILCYYHFGHDVLAAAVAAGFDDAEVLRPWSASHAYLGGLQSYFLFRKARA
jgi:SAM-dependent methyltransferase